MYPLNAKKKFGNYAKCCRANHRTDLMQIPFRFHVKFFFCIHALRVFEIVTLYNEHTYVLIKTILHTQIKKLILEYLTMIEWRYRMTDFNARIGSILDVAKDIKVSYFVTFFATTKIGNQRVFLSFSNGRVARCLFGQIELFTLREKILTHTIFFIT